MRLFAAPTDLNPDTTTTDTECLDERLDEGLARLSRYWSGETVDHDGPHYRVRATALLPATVQRPRPPVWIAGYWPRRRPMRRAARWDGAVPLFDGQAPLRDEVRDLVDYIAQHRDDRVDVPFDIVVGGASGASTVGDLIGPLRDAGATWWEDERQVQTQPRPLPRRAGAAPHRGGTARDRIAARPAPCNGPSPPIREPSLGAAYAADASSIKPRRGDCMCATEPIRH